MDENRTLLPRPVVEPGRGKGERKTGSKGCGGVKKLVTTAIAMAAMLGLALWAVAVDWPLFADYFKGGGQAGVATGRADRLDVSAAAAEAAVKGDKVLIDLFVMSRCPDAVKMEDVLSKVVPAVHSIMDVQLNFIASLDPNATYGAQCKHGDDECRGNIDELCALNHRPDLPSFWRFLQCLNARFDSIGRDPDLSLKCANSAGLDTAAFLACVSQSEGRALFKQSVENALFAGVKTSATLYIDGKPRCVEDGGWRDCPGGYRPNDFIRDICAAYKGAAPRPSICGQYRPLLGF
ncbi:hypothetical protein LPJ56_000970 [Coemansia sp. RSA 2599]|nr:hypothetical protein LPJ75_000812 [Coemansia sp. RSA 2598]KAJ1828659.1 hypothetical protein LPJ56_000970 [Coemansia sp. RSA 2599]